jgi:hypothetical protein
MRASHCSQGRIVLSSSADPLDLRLTRSDSPALPSPLHLSTLVLLSFAPLPAQTPAGSNVDVRTIVAVTIAEAEAQKLLPSGWKVTPIASGPNQGANLTLTFIDQLLNQSPDGKSSNTRTLAFGVPATNSATGASGNNVVKILTASPSGLPGPYKVASHASVRLEQAIKATDMEPAVVSERWEVRDQAGDTGTLVLEYLRALPTRNKTEYKVLAGRTRTSFASTRSTRAGTSCATPRSTA